MTYELEITQSPKNVTVWTRNKVCFGPVLSHSVNLQSIMYPQKIYK